MSLRPNWPALLFPLVLLLALTAFWPALSGPFLFDDLAQVKNIGGVDGQTDSAMDLTRLVFGRQAGVGRPLSYLSFLIEDNAWPTDPRPFKRTNLLLHLLNGVLVLTLARLLALALGQPRGRADWIGLIAMSLWLIHPIQITPTMMVVQRMTLLAGTFSLLALIAYVQGRRLAVGRPGLGYLWLVPGFGLALALGLLAKDVAIMTLCFVAALEATVLGQGRLPRPPGWRIWAGAFLVLPLAAGLAYLMALAPALAEGYSLRDWGPGERLLSQARVLMQYLRVILLPSLSQTGPFQDDFVPSRGLLDPPGTLAAVLAVAGLLGLAWGLRRRWPVFALAVLWFFLGHLLEGTLLPLELYFEHRNYLPMFGIWFALGYGVTGLGGAALGLAAVGLALVLALQAGILYLSAGVWGDGARMATVWAAERPGSDRGQILLLHYWAQQADTPRVAAALEQALAANPRSSGYRLYGLIYDRCGDPRLAGAGGSFAELEGAIPGSRYEPLSLESLNWLMTHRNARDCRFSPAEVTRLFDLFLANPAYTSNRRARLTLYQLYAGLQEKLGNQAGRDAALDQAFAAQSLFEIPLSQALDHARLGDFNRALDYLDKAAAATPTSLHDRLWRDHQVGQARDQVEALRRQGEGPRDTP